MDKELKAYEYGFEIHKITQIRLIKLTNKHGRLMLIIPVEMNSVNAVFRSMDESEATPAHKMFMNMVKALGGKIQKIVIDDLHGIRLFATIHYTNYEHEKFVAKAEASDAFAIAFIARCDVYVRKSLIGTVKNNRANRVYWYSADDEELLETVRATPDEDLATLPPDDLKQLLEIAAEIEDYEFAARLKKAYDICQDNLRKFKEMIEEYILENPEKFMEDLKKILDAIEYNDDES
jgi:bifunctional DNase/RNase